ncbi:MAG: hypothetical protein ACJ752_03975 [Gaiellaceae bacterium]
MKITIIGRGNVGGALQGLLSATVTRSTPWAARAATRPTGRGDPCCAGRCGRGRAPERERRGGEDPDRRDQSPAGRPDGVESLSAWAKSVANGPTAKAFNANFASLFAQAGTAGERPTMPICGDDEAVAVAEQLARECGFDPVVLGGLEHARGLEDYVGGVMIPLVMTRGPFFYRFDWPG